MHNLNCNQVVTLLTFYIEGKLNHKLAADVEYHLSTCSECRSKYQKLQQILENFNDIKNKIEEQEAAEIIDYDTPQYKVFRENLSAYVDNELDDNNNIKIKKIAIANPLARKDLEDIYSFKQLLQSSFNRTKNNMKYDFTKKTINKLFIQDEIKSEEPFNKIIAIFACILVTVLIGIFNLLNF